MPKYVVPDHVKESMKEALGNMELAEDILAKLRTAGMPRAEDEVRVREAVTKARRFAAAFDIDVD